MTFDLPVIPPQPPAAPSSDADLQRWQIAWANYRWAMQMHNDAACRAGQADARVALILAIDEAMRKGSSVTKDKVVLACISVVPPNIRQTENAWSSDVMKVADDLWLKMQADPAINPPAE